MPQAMRTGLDGDVVLLLSAMEDILFVEEEYDFDEPPT
jgi:hypothetical protein